MLIKTGVPSKVKPVTNGPVMCGESSVWEEYTRSSFIL